MYYHVIVVPERYSWHLGGFWKCPDTHPMLSPRHYAFFLTSSPSSFRSNKVYLRGKICSSYCLMKMKPRTKLARSSALNRHRTSTLLGGYYSIFSSNSIQNRKAFSLIYNNWLHCSCCPFICELVYTHKPSLSEFPGVGPSF